MCHLRCTTGGRVRRAGVWLTACAALAVFAGCNNKFFDPSQVGRFRPTPAVNVILDSLGVAEEPAVAWEEAQDPRPEDIRAVKTDYVLQPGDVVTVSIYELLQEGVPVTNNYMITETGKLSIPDVGIVEAAGLTETQLEDEIRNILSPNILRNPSVMVTLVTSQQRAFSILGNGVPSPGRYVIPRYDYRLTDALATAQVQMQFNVSHIYVSRREGAVAAAPTRAAGHAPELQVRQPDSSAAGTKPWVLKPADSTAATQKPDIPEPLEPAKEFETEREMLDLIAPQARKAWPRNDGTTIPAAAAPRKSEDMSASILPGGFRLLTPPSRPETPATTSQGIVQSPAEFGSPSAASSQDRTAESGTGARTEWLFDGKQWKQVPAANKTPAQPPAVPTQPPVVQTQPPTVQAQPPAARTQSQGQSEWALRNGNWVLASKGQAQPSPVTPPPAVGPAAPSLPLENGELPTEMEWEQAIGTRVIRIPTDRLLAGDPKYNVVIKPGDTIHVPVDLIGEFYIMGNVNRTGVIPITGRPMTLKMAIAAAGGLGPLAVPKRVEVIRRIGNKREEIVLVDLDRIASGEQPDFFIRPNDLINVGTDATSRWRAVLRNAFRAAYGFGFVYDRNFADADYYESIHLPDWF